MNSIRECILEVDDDANDIYFLRHAFKEAGIANPVRVVVDGEQAITYLSGTGPYADRTAYPLPVLVLQGTPGRCSSREFLAHSPALQPLTIGCHSLKQRQKGRTLTADECHIKLRSETCPQ